MANEKQVTIPDIGGAEGVDVIEILVNEGDVIELDTPLITLESDKASMEIPSSDAGVVKSINVKLGDKVSEGDVILVLESEEDTKATKEEASEESNDTVLDKKDEDNETSIPVNNETTVSSETVTIPDIGGATDVDVIDILVTEGQEVEAEQSLITLEGDKATMDIPAPKAGTVESISIKLGDKVSQGDTILSLKIKNTGSEASAETSHNDLNSQSSTPASTEQTTKEEPKDTSKEKTMPASDRVLDSKMVHAGPAVRRMAHELGVDLGLIRGSGRKGRITKDDLTSYIKVVMSQGGSGSRIAVAKAPSIDFSKFGDISVQPLNKIKRLTGENVHRSWVTVPHVTQFDEADITELEAFRKAEKDQAKKDGYGLTILAFVTKALAQALKEYPQFNASLSSDGQDLILKSYFNIGIAVDTPNGLVVPVIKNVDGLSVADIAREMGRLSLKAREKGLMPNDMNGGCMTISSLGGIGGTAFTPIVNNPEVAILGLSRAYIKPVYQNNSFVPRLMLPLSLSYDHRVIDGAEAARFTVYLSSLLTDIRKLIL